MKQKRIKSLYYFKIALICLIEIAGVYDKNVLQR